MLPFLGRSGVAMDHAGAIYQTLSDLRWAHAPIDGVREVMRDNGISHSDIEAIHINTFPGLLFQGVPKPS